MSEPKPGETCQGCYHHFHGCKELRKVACDRFVNESEWIDRQLRYIERARIFTIFSLAAVGMTTLALVAWVLI